MCKGYRPACGRQHRDSAVSVHEHASIHPQCPPQPDAPQPNPRSEMLTLPAPDAHSPPTHSKPPGPRWPPAAGKLSAAPQGCTTDGTSTLHDTTDIT